MVETGPRTYDEFWCHYLSIHRRWRTKLFHTIATLVGLTACLVLLPLTRNLWWPVLGMMAAYAIAWTSHLFIEKNDPPTFFHPYWSFFADFEMFVIFITGQMDRELRRLAAAPSCTSTRATMRHAVAIGWFGYLVLVISLSIVDVVDFRPLFVPFFA